MDDEQIETRFVQLAEAVTKVVDTVTKVADSQLSIQQLGGRLSEVALELRQEFRQIQQRQAESDQRFEVLLEEIRFLIRNQGTQGGNHD